METFSLHIPTRIEFGKDKEKNIGAYLNAQNIKKVLLVYGSNRIKRDGLFDIVLSSLAAHQISYVEFGGIVSNPVLSKVREGIEFARAENVDAILSVGGGSVLDSSKAIAAGVCYAGDVWDLFEGKSAIQAALPIFAILTLAATGSEMNKGAVVTNEQTKQKFAISSQHTYPTISIINPELMKTVTKDYLVYSAADIIAHVIETYFTAKIQPHMQSRLAESVIKTVIETTEILIADPDNYDARGEFAWASTMALNGVTRVGSSGYTHPNHMIEHSLSALYNVPHGAGLSVVIPAWMKWYSEKNEIQFTRFAKEIFDKKTAKEGIEALENWFNQIGTPTKLQQLNITPNQLDEIVVNVLDNARYFGVSDIYTKPVIESILKNAFAQ